MLLFLDVEPSRPLYGVVAAHNAGSIRVLQKCGFVVDQEPEASDSDPEVVLVLC